MTPIPPLERVWVEALLDVMALDPETARESVGLPCGRRCPEYGPSIQELECCNCGATWAGIAGDPCGWCEDALERQRGYQAELLLTPPDVHPDDATYSDRMAAWAERMAVGIAAGLITEQQARRAALSVDRKAA